MELGSGLIAALVVGFPLGLFAMVWVLGWLEAWMVQPDERAAAVQALLAQEGQVDDLERAVADLMAQVADDRRRERAAPARIPARIGQSAPAGSGVS